MTHTETFSPTTSTAFMGNKKIPYNRILVVDDSEVDFFIASKTITRHNPSAFMLYANSVDSALNMLRDSSPATLPDLILLDLNFDRQTKQGIDFLKEFGKLSLPSGSRIKVIVLTAYAGFRDIRSITNEFSVTAILEKPFTLDKMAGY